MQASTSSSNKNDELVKLYGSIADEIKVRLLAVKFAYEGNMTEVPGRGMIIAEFCYLQFRMVCELIALGCLVAHGDLEGTATNKFMKEYSAERILKMLTELEPEFFPYPITMYPDPRDPKNTLLGGPRSKEYATKDDVIALYNEAGGHLHRGTRKKFIPYKSPVQTKFPQIHETAQRLWNLMVVHSVILSGGTRTLLCNFSVTDRPEATIDNPGGVWVAVSNLSPDSPARFSRPKDGSGAGL